MQRGVSAQAEATRDAILRCAVSTIAREGIEGATLQGVAASAGLSKGALTHHFSSKDDLVDAVVMRCAEAIAAELSAAVEGVAPGGAQLHAIASALWRAWDGDRDEARVLTMVSAAALHDARLRATSDGAFAAATMVVARTLEDAARVAGLRAEATPTQLARALIAAALGGRLVRGDESSEALFTRTLNALFRL